MTFRHATREELSQSGISRSFAFSHARGLIGVEYESLKYVLKGILESYAVHLAGILV